MTPPTFAYQAHGGSNRIDQMLSITNPNTVDVAPVLAFTPVSGDGSVLPGVRVGTAYGSDRGELAVCPGGGFDEPGPAGRQRGNAIVLDPKLLHHTKVAQ
ncbi:hypothetical protein [Kitasatospora sp. MBT63]|uniref:hypothetical protein n=1 Tax=Kitasatospora sp. MBT63 TaxID=1444768 RepID=UPI0011EA6E14|nr:hypothetical protein [Kitasatospora sp. MBT63]